MSELLMPDDLRQSLQGFLRAIFLHPEVTGELHEGAGALFDHLATLSPAPASAPASQRGGAGGENPYADLSRLAALILRLPEPVGLDLRLWNAGADLNDVPTIGVVWDAYTTGRGAADYLEDVEGCHGFTVEGPRAAADYIEEYLESILAPADAGAQP